MERVQSGPPTVRAHARRWRVIRWLFTLGVAGGVVALLWFRTGPPAEPSARLLTVYGFSALQNVMEQDVFPAFQATWAERTGEHVEILATWAGSATLVERILRKLPVQVALLSSEIDADRLRRNGLVLGGPDPTVRENEILAASPIVLAVREGNPWSIREFSDLARPGVSIVHPDPETSGAGEWGVVSVYSAALQRTGNPVEAEVELAAVWRNVATRPPSARRAMTEFQAGAGDVLITYEAEIREALRRGDDLVLVRPSRTGLVEHVLVAVSRNVDESERALVGAFLEHLGRPGTREQLASRGFQVAGSGDEDPPYMRLSDLGGADRVEREILDHLWRERIGRASAN